MRLKCIGGPANGECRDLKEGERGIPVYVFEPSYVTQGSIEDIGKNSWMATPVWYYRRHLVFTSLDGKQNKFEFLSPHDVISVSDLEVMRELLT